MSREPRWLPRTLVLALHEQFASEHGGVSDAYDERRLEAALARPRTRQAYEDSSVFRLAAAYAFGIAREQPFPEGNPRVALTLAAVFLEMNGWRLQATEADAGTNTVALAAGELDEGAYAMWLEAASAPLEFGAAKRGH